VATSYLAAGCRVGRGASVSGSLLAEGVVVADGVHVPEGCVVGPGLTLATAPEPFARLHSTTTSSSSSSTSASTGGATTKKKRGPDESFFGQEDSDLEEDDEDVRTGGVWDPVRASSMAPPLEARRRRDALWQNEEEEEDLSAGAAAHLEDEDLTEQDTTASFGTTVRDMIRSGHDGGHDVASISMELNCFKLSANRSYADTAPAVLAAVLGLAGDPGTSGHVLALRDVITHWKPILAKFVTDDDDVPAQARVLDAPLAAFQHHPDAARATLQFLYDAGVLSDDAILHWAAATSLSALCASPPIADFLHWLDDDEDEDDEDDDDDDDEEED